MTENNDSKSITSISEYGEFGLIDHLTQNISLSQETSKIGVGDDAAVIDANGLQTIVSTDMFIEGIHFDFLYCPLKHIGYKSIVTSLSDIYAMGGQPTQVLVSLALSNKIGVETLEEIYEGILLACKTYNVDLVGGDTTSSFSGTNMSVTSIGHAKPEQIIKRSGAKENDLICVTGDLGAAYMGLHLLEREKSVYKEDKQFTPDFSGYEYLIQRQLKPEAQKELMLFLREQNIQPSSMIDISDGLSSELLHICKQSKVGCVVYEDRIPVDISTTLCAEEFRLAPIVAAMNGGEDYEMLFTANASYYEQLKNKKEISVIGHIVEKAQDAHLVLKGSNELQKIESQGWNPIKK